MKRILSFLPKYLAALRADSSVGDGQPGGWLIGSRYKPSTER